ncbi:HAMP domain-containing sensor histidine kinase [Anaerosporobacter faecicola]|uniref:HAMP domain-containing sensor histidine kinase n=1 Tax=Anaerosporobacter faecicola TaxID=2718714 RepID=UPI001439DE7B|nr:HAMP domain-containing sensor histidine kinase [Anaerosporobacter faecicola]
MGNVVQRKGYSFGLALGILFLALLSLSVLLVQQMLNQDKLDEKKVRVICNDLVYQVEEILTQADTVEEHIWEDISNTYQRSYCILDLSGTVCFSNINRYQKGAKVNLHTFGMVEESKKEYRIPIMKGEQQAYYAIISIDDTKFQKSLWKPSLFWYGLLIALVMGEVCILYRSKQFLQEDILAPVEEIHHATNAIMSGDFSQKVKYDYDGEIGGLCHDFELMRGELKDSFEREKQYKKKEILLLASISHDLKTPLATVGNYVEGILYDVVESKQEIKEYAQIILNKVTYLNGLIDDILEHSKAGLHQFQIEKKDCYADDYFQKTLQIFQQDAEQKGFRFTYQSFPKVVLHMDTKRITQVLHNLVDNAIKYGKPCGAIHVTNQIIKKSSKSYLLVCVADDGIGIRAADLPYIFETFYRGDKARNQKIGGSGLGLHIARYIVEQHGGEMDCDSIYGKGTTISFTIPI